MQKTSLLAGFALAAALTIPPAVAGTLTSQESCLDMLENVQAAIAEKDLSPDARADIGKMVEGLSKQCWAGQYAEAAATAKTIRERLAKY